MALTFLTAEWRKLIMAQYEVRPELLQRKLPPGLELDLYEGRCFVSLVGFLFARIRVLGLPIPFHTQFEEVNLRYYVRRRLPDGSSRRGVVFLSEIVPKPAVAALARSLYGEAYSFSPMTHICGLAGSIPEPTPPKGGRRRAKAHFRALKQRPPAPPSDAVEWHPSVCQVEYEWKHNGLWQRLGVRADNRLIPMLPGSMEEFISEHYWGYTPTRGGGTAEYPVEHPRWEMYPVREHRISCDFGALYGQEFAHLTGRSPDHILLAEGAPVRIRWRGTVA